MRRASLFLFILLFILASCGGGKKSKQNQTDGSEQTITKPVQETDETKELMAYLEKNGDYVRSQNFPSMMDASEVHEKMDPHIYIIDLRSPESYEKGHIKGSHRVQFTELANYFKNTIKPSDYERIVLVSYAGQISGYATSLLRLMGYNNVYSMRWGMSSWNKDFAEYSWLDVVSDEYADLLDTITYSRNNAGKLPEIHTGKTTGQEIAQVRFDKIFEEGTPEVLISAEEVFEEPEKYYIINYDRRDRYESGHIPGAIRYRPNVTLGYVQEMETIPTDKEVVVYCNTGQNSAFVTAYLRLLGYNAKSLMYGANAFMHEKMEKEKKSLSWVPFSKSDIEKYDYVTD